MDFFTRGNFYESLKSIQGSKSLRLNFTFYDFISDKTLEALWRDYRLKDLALNFCNCSNVTTAELYSLHQV